MFGKVGQIAERSATEISVTRRGFLGRLGRMATMAAGAIGGVLLASGSADAGRSVCRNPTAYQACVTACWNWCLTGGRSGKQCTRLCSDRNSGCLQYC
jgi:hypothetical protein